MSNLPRILSLAILMLLGGCQVNHTLPEPTLDHEQTLPPVSVQTLGLVPGTLIRNHLRSTGVFEQVREGFDPGGYNIQVVSAGDYYGFSNLPNQFLSAFSFFIIPASVSWDSALTFRVTRGQEAVTTYQITNKTTHYNGLFVHPDGRDDNIRRIIDSFAARVQADAALFKLTPLKPVHTPMPVAPATLQQHTALIVSYQVNADGSVSDVTVAGDAPELAHSAVEETVRTWRYEPWTPSPEAPATQRTSRPIILSRSPSCARRNRAAPRSSRNCKLSSKRRRANLPAICRPSNRPRHCCSLPSCVSRTALRLPKSTRPSHAHCPGSSSSAVPIRRSITGST